MAIYRFLGWSGSHHYRFSLTTVGGKSIATDCTSTVAEYNIDQNIQKIKIKMLLKFTVKAAKGASVKPDGEVHTYYIQSQRDLDKFRKGECIYPE